MVIVVLLFGFKTVAQCSFHHVSVHADLWNRVFEKLVVAHPVKKLPPLCGILIAESKRLCHYCVLSHMKPVHNHCMSLRSVFILSFHLSLSSKWPLAFKSSSQNFVCISHLSSACMGPVTQC